MWKEWRMKKHCFKLFRSRRAERLILSTNELDASHTFQQFLLRWLSQTDEDTNSLITRVFTAEKTQITHEKVTLKTHIYLFVCRKKIRFVSQRQEVKLETSSWFTVRLFTGSTSSVFIIILSSLKWNSCQKATEALFVIEYESNLRVKHNYDERGAFMIYRSCVLINFHWIAGAF